MKEAITIKGLTKVYGNGTRALDGVDLAAYEDEILCVAGPNGAGKTTSLRIVGTQLLPTSGTVEVLGADVVEDSGRVRAHLGVVPQEATPDPELRVWEQIYFYLRARGASRAQARARAEEALSAVDLLARRNHIIYDLSGGQRRRVLIAMAVATRAEVLLLDEPTTGLDPVARRDAWRTFLELKQGRCILLTTHSMEEAEVLADRVAIIDKGKVIAAGSVAELKKALPAKQKILVGKGLERADLERFGEVDTIGDKFVVYPTDKAARGALVDLALQAGQEASVAPTTLDDIYLRIIRTNNDTGATGDDAAEPAVPA